MASTHLNKYSRSFVMGDKENNGEISNTIESLQNSKYLNGQKLRRTFVSQKSLPQGGNASNTNNSMCKNNQEGKQIVNNSIITDQSITGAAPQAMQTSLSNISNASILALQGNNGTQQMQTITAATNTILGHSKTEENLKEIFARKLNAADKVKRNLNNEISIGGGLQQLQICDDDESNNKDILKKTNKEINAIISDNILQENKMEVNGAIKNDLQIKEWTSVIANQNNQIKKSNSTLEIQFLKDIENINIIKNYSQNILDYMKKREKDTTPINALLKHNIPINLRAKMVDWMIEVLSSYKCAEQTFFLAVRVMDLFFSKTNKVNEIGDLHLVGVTSMFIACKQEEIYPMKLQIVHDKIAHRKLSIDSIKKKESEILQTIQFNLIGATPYEISMHVLCRINIKDQIDKKIALYLEKICIYLAKMILYDYDLICQRDYALLSGALIFVAFKIIEQIDQNFKAEEKIKDVIKAINLQQDILIETAAKILNLAKSFDKQYPNLENLKKFNGFSLEETGDNIKNKLI